MKINKYPDGTSYVTIPEEWYGTEQEITFRINSYEDLWHLKQLCNVLTYNHVKAVITLPNLLDAQADRRFSQFQSRGLIEVLDTLNEYKEIAFRIFHPHNPEVVEAILDKVDIIDNGDFIKMVIYNEICPGPGFADAYKMDNLILMSSDAGGFKPLMKLCEKLDWQGETYSASKSRSYVEGKSKLTQIVDREDFGGKDILIVDDISVYGGTFKGLSKLLRERNVRKLYLAVSHMTVQNLGDDPITNYFDKVFTTNSKFDKYTDNYWAEPENLEIIKLF